MTSETQNYGFTKLGPGEGVHAGTGRFPSADRDLLDEELHRQAQHRHTGSAGVEGAPELAPVLTVSTTGGTIPAGTTVRYVYTYVDPTTGETTASPEASTTTAAAITAPDAPTFTLQAIGGTLEPGQYFYVLTAYQGSTTIETKALNAVSVLIPAGTSTNEVTLTLPALPSGATGFNVYRRAPNESKYFFLETSAGPDYVDQGTAATARSIPSENTTNSTYSIEVDLPGATPSIPAGNTWVLYRSYSTSYVNTRLVELDDATFTYTDIGDATSLGTPPSVSVGGNPSKVLLTGAAEVQGTLPIANVDFVLDEDDMVSDSDVHVPTQQSTKAYVDAHAGTTNLSYTAATSTVASDTGTDAVLTVVDATNPGLMLVADKTKLDGVETAATADQTGAEIKAAYEAEADTNAFTDAEQTKLSGVETGATATTAALTTVAATGATEDLVFAAAPDEAWVEAVMDQNCTFSFSGATASSVYRVHLILSGAFTPSWSAAVTWAGGTEPTYTSPSVYEFVTTDGGTTVYGRGN